MNILEVNNLKKIYHTKESEILAVDNFSFNLKKGEFVAIVGPSGCGKSTILSILCGLDEPTYGNIKVDSKVKFGYMLQGDTLFDWRTIYKNCLIGLEIQDKTSNIDYVNNLLKSYGLYDFKDAYPSSLSGGMRQRVALIRTLSIKPDILLLDEPTSALDYQTGLLVSDDLHRIIKNENKSAIMVTHDIAMAISMADRVIVMSKRPGCVKSIYEIDLENKSYPTENRKDKKFTYYYDKIWKDIDHHV